MRTRSLSRQTGQLTFWCSTQEQILQFKNRQDPGPRRFVRSRLRDVHTSSHLLRQACAVLVVVIATAVVVSTVLLFSTALFLLLCFALRRPFRVQLVARLGYLHARHDTRVKPTCAQVGSIEPFLIFIRVALFVCRCFQRFQTSHLFLSSALLLQSDAVGGREKGVLDLMLLKVVRPGFPVIARGHRSADRPVIETRHYLHAPLLLRQQI